jgi:aminopeptidase N
VTRYVARVRSAIAAAFVAAAITGCVSTSAGVQVLQADAPQTTASQHTSGAPPATDPPDTTGASPATTVPAPSAGPSGVGDPLFPDLGNPGIDVTHYDIDVAYDPPSRRIDASATLAIVATTDLDRFTLDAIGLDVTSVEIDGVEVGFNEEDPELIVDPQTPLRRGDTFDVSLAYSATAQLGDAAASAGWFATDTGSFVLNEPDGARTWLPSNDYPSDKASYHFTILVPAGLTGVANGTLQTHTTQGVDEIWVWDQPEPMATYLIQVLTGNFELVDGVGPNGLPLLSAIQQGDHDAMQAFLDVTPEQIDFFDDYFGPYPLAAYGIAMTDGAIGGGMEEQGRSLFSAGDFERHPDFVTHVLLAHELAHQWFGDSVSPADWQDIWLNESFATYAEWMWVEHVGYGTVDSAAQANLEQRQDSSGVTGLPTADGLFGYEVYEGGAVVLHALRLTVGDDAFFAILEKWSHDNYGESSTSQAFIDLASSVAGQDLTEFFDEWLYSADLPDNFPA